MLCQNVNQDADRKRGPKRLINVTLFRQVNSTPTPRYTRAHEGIFHSGLLCVTAVLRTRAIHRDQSADQRNYEG